MIVQCMIPKNLSNIDLTGFDGEVSTIVDSRSDAANPQIHQIRSQK